MAKLTIYLPDAIEKRFRGEARRVKKSVSAYIASLGSADRTGDSGWPESFEALYGSMALAAPPDPVPEAPALGAQVPARYERLHRVPRRR